MLRSVFTTMAPNWKKKRLSTPSKSENHGLNPEKLSLTMCKCGIVKIYHWCYQVCQCMSKAGNESGSLVVLVLVNQVLCLRCFGLLSCLAGRSRSMDWTSVRSDFKIYEAGLLSSHKTPHSLKERFEAILTRLMSTRIWSFGL